MKKLIIDDNNILTYKYYEDYVSEKELYAQASYNCPRPLFSKANRGSNTRHPCITCFRYTAFSCDIETIKVYSKRNCG